MQQMATCPNCGAQNASNQQFCVSCGSHLTGSPRPVSHVPIVTGVAPPPVMQPVLPAPPVVTVAPAPAVPAGVVSRQVEIRPTWGLAWGLFWRMFFLWLFLAGLVLLGIAIATMLGYRTFLYY